MVTADPEAIGVEAVRIAIAEIAVRDPELAQQLRIDQTGRSATTGGGVHWCIAFQLGKVTNPSDTTGTVTPRVAAQLTIQRRDSERRLAALAVERARIEAAVGHPLSWLPGGEAGRKLRSIVRSWRPVDASAERLGAWMADELLKLRAAVRPHAEAVGAELP